MRQIPVTTAVGKTPCCTNIHTDDTHEVRVIAVVDSGSNLLDRAQTGWERFLSTFEGAPGE
ncbi:hypothetical protein [Streptomyces sp. NPDC058157]|uniref:hypothetical protein n=1 Tax=Streptomyces sp. NPDC058157 TaxID=3346360 RepID=UPI0036E7B193